MTNVTISAPILAETEGKRLDGVMDVSGHASGPWGRGLFEDPKARSLSRVGVVDVGSNSVRLVVFDGAARSPAYFYNEKILCGLGADLRQTGKLSSTGRKRAMAALKRFQLVAKSMEIDPLITIGTAALREAEDGDEFRKEIEQETGIQLWVIDGEEEARLSAQGVLLGWPEAEGVVCDIGGSSMELAILQDGRVGQRVTSPLAPQVLATVKGGQKGRRAFIRDQLQVLKSRLPVRGRRVYLVGGSWRAIAKIDMARCDYPLRVQHEYRLKPKSIIETTKFISSHSQAELCAMTGVSAGRMALVPLAAEVIRPLIAMLSPKEIAISSYGIREGMLYEQMPDQLRVRDPLIEACRFAEAKDARVPGFGRTLLQFVRPLFKASGPARQRLIEAACLLHDVSWRAHPDYRAEVCFDNVTRANLGGLTHEERVFLGLALLHRYKNSRANSPYARLFELLDEKDVRQAEVLGKAMRLGAMFSVEASEMEEALRWHPKKKKLEIRVLKPTAALFGEVARSRFQSLCNTLEAEGTVRFR